MKENLFIALEGIDGSGKSTHVKLLAEKLKAAGHKVYATFEPTDGQIGSMLRNILKGTVKADERVIAALFVADRLDHLLNESNGLVKKLEEGYTVITDRYYFSSYAYNSIHMPMDWVIQANSLSADIRRPDVNVFIDLPPEVAMQRVQKNRQTIELYETLDNLTAVRDNYLKAFDLLKDKEKMICINGDNTIEGISEDIWKALDV